MTSNVSVPVKVAERCQDVAASFYQSFCLRTDGSFGSVGYQTFANSGPRQGGGGFNTMILPDISVDLPVVEVRVVERQQPETSPVQVTARLRPVVGASSNQEASSEEHSQPVPSDESKLILPTTERLLCKICMTSELTCALLPCKHHALCRDCATQVLYNDRPQCPICRAVVRDFIETYIG